MNLRNRRPVKLGPGDPGIIDQVEVGAAIYKDGNIRDQVGSKWSNGGGWACRLSLYRDCVTEKGGLSDDPEVDLVGIPEKMRRRGHREIVSTSCLDGGELAAGAQARSGCDGGISFGVQYGFCH